MGSLPEPAIEQPEENATAGGEAIGSSTGSSATIISKLRIGDLLINEGYLTDEKLQQALDYQKTKRYLPIGEVCIELGFLSRLNLKQVLRKYRKKIALGELLLNLGIINIDQLNDALEEQKQSHKKLGLILQEKSCISERVLVDVLSVQLGIPKISPSPELIDRKLLNAQRKEFYQRNLFLPIFMDDQVLTIVCNDPLDEEKLRQLELTLGCEIDPAICTTNEILNAINRIYSMEDAKRKPLTIGKNVLNPTADDSVVDVVNYIFSSAIEDAASDIHIEPQEFSLRIRLRVDGILIHKTDLPKSLIKSLVSRVKVLCGLDITEKRKYQDGRIEANILGDDVDLRVSTYPAIWGENIVIRILHRKSSFIGLELLGFAPRNYNHIKRILDYPSGVILVTGPTGSGKTTTLYSCLNYLNKLDKSIITIEDPVEYVIDGIVQARVERKGGGLSYMDALKSMMRQDPDVIMVGEIRDNEAAQATIQAALTGHKVFSTFHTEDTTTALLRLMDMGIDTFLISSTVVSVISQRLVRTICSACKEERQPDPELLQTFRVSNLPVDQALFHAGRGCIQCNHTGYKGRTGIHELLLVNDQIRQALLDREPSSFIRKIAIESGGLVTLKEDGFYKAVKGMTTLEEIMRVVYLAESSDLAPRDYNELMRLCDDPDGAQQIGYATANNEPEPSNECCMALVLQTDRISDSIDQITEFFKAYQSLRWKSGQPVELNANKEFVMFVSETAKRYRRNFRASEFSLFLTDQDGRAAIKSSVMVPLQGIH